jgi:hypothetical protein
VLEEVDVVEAMAMPTVRGFIDLLGELEMELPWDGAEVREELLWGLITGEAAAID